MPSEPLPAYAGRTAPARASRKAARRAAARALLLAPLLVATGCAFGPSPRPLPAGDVPPWRLPEGADGSQRLYRVSYSGPQGEGSFRLTLRLADPERYQVTSSDPVGRALWSLDVSSAEGAERGLWLDHRNRVFCEFEGRFDLVGVPLAPFPLLSLPSLLLGRLPAEPAGEPKTRDASLSYDDSLGRHWMAVLRKDGLIQSWTMSNEKGPAVFWVRNDSWSILSDRTQGAQVRWREVLREALEARPEPLVAPAAYRREDCRETYEETGESGNAHLYMQGEHGELARRAELTAPSPASSIRWARRPGGSPSRLSSPERPPGGRNRI
jgi:hypothetical protein